MKSALTFSTTFVLSLLSASVNAQVELNRDNNANGQIVLDPYTVVVLPLEIVGDDPRAADLAAVAYDDIVAQLAAIDGLYVLGGESLLPYAGLELPPEEIARQLGAAHVLTGSVWVGEYSLLLEFGYTDVETGKQVGSTSFGARPGTQRPIRVYPDKLLPNAIPPVIESIRARVFPERQADHRQELAKSEVTFLDVSRSDNERLEALRELIDSGGTGGEPLFDVAIVAAVDMALGSDDYWIRDEVWSHLGHIRDPYLVQPLLHSLANDSHEVVRKRAATVLRNFLDKPGVREALTYAGEYDPSAQVRREARFSVILPDAQRAELEAMVLDSVFSDQERSHAFFELWFNHGEVIELSRVLMSTMIDMATNSDDARIRRNVWFGLGQYGHAQVVDPLLEALAKDPDEEVRSAVVEELRQFLGQSLVRESLEAALANDSSALVRKRLEDVLGHDNS